MSEGAAAAAATAATVYLLRNARGRTYVGCALDPARRLRQHNGELAGGAAQTARGRPWAHVLAVRGFRTYREGLQFEYAWRRVHRRRRDAYTVAGRRASLAALLARERWSRAAPPAAEVPLTIVEAGAAGPAGGGPAGGGAAGAGISSAAPPENLGGRGAGAAA